MKRAIVLGVVTATVLLTFRALNITSVAPEPWDARPFDHPSNGIERALLLHDGQTYAALAQDPMLRQPELFYGDTDEQAYRAARPMLPWLAWAASVGRASVVPSALFVLSIAGVAAMVASAAGLARALGRDPDLAWVVLALPGSIAAMSHTSASPTPSPPQASWPASSPGVRVGCRWPPPHSQPPR